MKKIFMVMLIAVFAAFTLGTGVLAAGEECHGENRQEDARREAAEKFAELSEREKDEIYSVTEDAVEKFVELMEKYTEYGLVTEEKTNTISKMLTDMVQNAQSRGELPLFSTRPYGSFMQNEKNAMPEKTENRYGR